MTPPTFHALLSTLAFPTTLIYLIFYLLPAFFPVQMRPDTCELPKGRAKIWSSPSETTCKTVALFLMKVSTAILGFSSGSTGKGAGEPTSHHNLLLSPLNAGKGDSLGVSIRKKTSRVQDKEELTLIERLQCSRHYSRYFAHLIQTIFHWNVHWCPIFQKRKTRLREVKGFV